jgi:tetratricopeptide (TPR) repeat protein
VYLKLEFFDQAKTNYEDALSKLKGYLSKNDPIIKEIKFLNEVLIFKEIEEFDEKVLLEMINKISQITDDISCNIDYLQKSDIEESDNLIKSQIDTLDYIRNRIEFSNTLSSALLTEIRGKIRQATDKSDNEAIKLYIKHIEELEEKKVEKENEALLQRRKSFAHKRLGLIYHNNKCHTLALKSLLNSFEIAIENSEISDSEIGMLSYHIAQQWLKLEDSENAKEYYEIAPNIN